MTQKNKDWSTDYDLFLQQEGTSVPEGVSQNILKSIGRLLKPNPYFVFLKILGIHSLMGFLSLSVCHQFGINPFNTSASLSDWVMNLWGHGACMVFCGILFVSLGLGLSGFFLTLEEIKELRHHQFLQTLALGSISLLIFFMIGADLAIFFAGLWLLGALLGGVAATETIWFFRKMSLQS